MKTIYQYPISIEDEFTVDIPDGAAFLKADMQNDEPVMWAMVDSEEKVSEEKFAIFGTGHELPNDADYIDTFYGNEYVWHLFKL